MKYRFDQIAINSTVKKKPIDADKEHYIGLEHLDSDCLIVSRWGAEVTPIGEKLLMQKGDILFGKRRAYQRKVGIAPFDGIFSAHGMVLRPKENVVIKENECPHVTKLAKFKLPSCPKTMFWNTLCKI